MNLTRTEMVWARDAFVGIFPGPDGIAQLDVDGYVKRTFKNVPLEAALGLRLAIWIVALAPLFVLHRLRTIHGVSPEDREVVLVRLASSPVYAVRQLVLALKAMAAFLFAGDPGVYAKLFAPKPVVESGPVLLRVKPGAHDRGEHEPEHHPDEEQHDVRVA